MRTLRPGRMGGSEMYARGLVQALAENGSLEYCCLVPSGARDAADGLPSRSGRTPAAVRAVHYPFTVAYPPTRRPLVVTLHDVLHHEAHEPIPLRRRLIRRITYDVSARRARLVIVPSAFVRERAHALLGLPLEALRVVPHGIDHERFQPGPEQREEFLFYPAQEPWPHKNHRRLLEAFRLLRADRPGLELLLTGTGFGPVPAGVRVLGRVGADELSRLYRRAGALVFPSLYEGFGLPPLEAMACGCPVASSNAASLPEVCGGAAVFFDPLSPDEIAAAAARALDDDGALARRGLERAAKYTWLDAAVGHEAIYRELVS